MLYCSPEETATVLFEENYPVENYVNGIQKERTNRLQRLLNLKAPEIIIEKEKELIEHGKQVIALLKLMYKGIDPAEQK